MDTKKIIAEVKTIAADMSRKIDEGKTEIVEHVDAVAVKVDRLKISRKRKSRHSIDQHEICLACWNAAQSNEQVRGSINTRITHETVFRFFSRRLAEHGITTAKQFHKILHAAQSRECEARKRKLDAQRDGRRKEVSQQPPKNGKMAGVKNTLKAAFALTLATIGVAAPCAASARAVRISEPPLASCGVAQTPPDAASDAIRAEVRGRVIRVADGDTLTVLDAANNQHKIRLNAIDAPESKQAFGQKSKQRLSDYVFGKDVTVKWKSKDCPAL